MPKFFGRNKVLYKLINSNTNVVINSFVSNFICYVIIIFINKVVNYISIFLKPVQILCKEYKVHYYVFLNKA